MRSERKRPAWPAIPANSGAPCARVMSRGEFNRSIVVAAFGVAVAAMISLQPAHSVGGLGAAHEPAAGGRTDAVASIAFPGDGVALARVGGDSRGIVFCIDDGKACTPTPAPPERPSSMADLAIRAFKHQAAGL